MLLSFAPLCYLILSTIACGPAASSTALPGAALPEAAQPGTSQSETITEATPNPASPVAPAVDPGRAGRVDPADNYISELNAILEQVLLEGGLIRYDLLRGELNTRFRGVLKAVEVFEGPLTTDQAKLAFWINAYNVQMLQTIVENPEVANIIADGKVDAFFKTRFLTAGKMLTLDEIEHVILRASQPEHEYARLAVEQLDPRIHVGLNCAAVSCPELSPLAFTAEAVDGQLDTAMKRFANDDHHFLAKDGSFVLSSLIDWFAADWESDGPAGDYLLSYMSESRNNHNALAALLDGASVQDLRNNPSVEFDYNWDVNAAP